MMPFFDSDMTMYKTSESTHFLERPGGQVSEESKQNLHMEMEAIRCLRASNN